MSEPLPIAQTSRRRRISIMWIIPLVAVAIGLWLAWDTLSKEGPLIEISFQSAEGLQAGQSQLKFKDIVFGTVSDFRLSDDHSHVIVKVATTRQAMPLLTDQTAFWVVRPRLFAGSLSGLGTLLSGSYIEMMPPKSGGDPAHVFTGQEDPPVLEADVEGHTYLVKAARLGSISFGSPVFFHDLNVGEVLGLDLSDIEEGVTLHVFVRAPFDAYVRDGTRFWDASGLAVKIGGTGVDLQVELLRALLLGGVAFDTPAEAKASEVSADNHVFPLFKDRETANDASYSRKIPLISHFPGSVRGLAAGSEVTVHGLTVGRVTDVRLTYDAPSDAVLASVRYEIEPERVVGVGVQYYTPEEFLTKAIGRGLRASLQSVSLVTGQQAVALDFAKNAPEASLAMEGSDFVLPVTEGDGFAALEASAATLLDHMNQIPFSDIGTGLQKTITNTNNLVASVNNGYGDNSNFNRDMERLMAQLKDAIRSIRSFAETLAQHPEALIKGRPEGGKE